MTSEAPPFWWEPVGAAALFLSPFSAVYGLAAGRVLKRDKCPEIDLPVLCVGNFTVGGSGKTPVAIAIAQRALRLGMKPGFVSRGHGGSLSGVHLVDPQNDSARLTGDEPLLLARTAPTAASANRLAAARLLKENGCDFIIMDDGFQSRRLHMDYALMVVDAYRGIGNGQVIPAGPLRARLVDQLRRTDALLTVGTGSAADKVVRMAARAAKPIFQATLAPLNAEVISGKPCLAFAGIGNPEKFFDTVTESGGWLSLTRSFGDHHFYSDEEIGELTGAAAAMDLQLVTTAKDAARLSHGSAAAREMLDKAAVLEVGLEFDPPSSVDTFIGETRKRFDHRSQR
jgi:tetraacyldisaccharide 4'-kinase